MSDQKEPASFLNRWSARKQQSTRPLPVETAPENTATVETAAVETAAVETADVDLLTPEALAEMDSAAPARVPLVTDEGLTDEILAQRQESSSIESVKALLTDADMPAIDTLTASSDLSVFFSKGVSTALRKAALRHVFRQPSYNVRDGLDDYDGDYTSFEPLGDTVTADMKFHAARKERARLEAELLKKDEAALAHELPDSAEAVQDNPASPEEQAAIKPADESEAAAQDSQSDGDQEEHPQTRQAEARQQTEPLHDQPQDPTPATQKPLNKPAQATALPPCEIPNE